MLALKTVDNDLKFYQCIKGSTGIELNVQSFLSSLQQDDTVSCNE